MQTGFTYLSNQRLSPAYYKQIEHRLMAWIRQLGKATFFMTLTMAEAHWPDILRILYKSAHPGLEVPSDNDLLNLSYKEKCELIKSDPVVIVRHFNKRLQWLFKNVLQNENGPLGLVLDYVGVVEAQFRASLHIHFFAYVKDAPQIDVASDEEIVVFIDKTISCSRTMPEMSGIVLTEEERNLPQTRQLHRHTSRACFKGNRKVCRYGFPQLPMPATFIARPLGNDISKAETDKLKVEYNFILTVIEKLPKGNQCNLTFEQFLLSTGFSLERYFFIIRSSVKKMTIFLKRLPSEVRVNPYNPFILLLWKANMDIQMITDIYAAAKYLASYMSKSNKGMSDIMRKASKPKGDISSSSLQQLRDVGRKFIRGSELSAQEAACLLIQQPLFYSTRTVVFINTGEVANRGFMIKPYNVLQTMSDDSTDIAMNNFQKRYVSRPVELKNVCLADWFSQFVYVPPTKKDSDWKKDTDFLCHGDTDDESIDAEETKPTKHELSCGGSVRKIKDSSHYKIIRYVRYSILSDRENHFRELLMLFYPFENESEICGNCASYEERYTALLECVETKRKEYEYWRGDLDKARDELAEEHYPEPDSRIAPNTRHQDDRDILIGDRVICDSSVVDVARECLLPDLMTDTEFFESVCQLNGDQEKFFTEIVSREKFKLFEDVADNWPFLSGGGGTGKSHLIKSLFQALVRIYRPLCNNPAKPTVGIVAYTALAARNISGTTIHSFLGLKFGINPSNVREITPNVLSTYQFELSDLRFLFIDEISFVGSNLLHCIDQRIQHITRVTKPFGGISVLFVGDLFQLQPIMDGNVFATPKIPLGKLAYHPWKELTTMYELTVIVRQSEISWAQLLNRLREGLLTAEDVARLQGLTNRPRTDTSVLRACRLVKNVDSHNLEQVTLSNAPKYESIALDIVEGDMSGNTEFRDQLLRIAKVMSTADTASMAYSLSIVIDLPFIITTNVDKSDGLINGTIGVVKEVYMHEVCFCLFYLLIFDFCHWCSTYVRLFSRKR